MVAAAEAEEAARAAAEQKARANSAARAKLEQQFDRLQKQVEEERRQRNQLVSDTDGLSQAVRTLAGTVDDLRVVKVERPELDAVNKQLDELVQSFGELETQTLGEIVAEVEDHKQGLHHMMDMIEATVSSDDVERLLGEAEERSRASTGESVAKVQESVSEVQQLLVGDIDALHADTEASLGALWPLFTVFLASMGNPIDVLGTDDFGTWPAILMLCGFLFFVVIILCASLSSPSLMRASW